MKSRTYDGLKITGGVSRRVADALTVEEALQININGKPYTVTMRTPGDDLVLIRGLFYTEEIYQGQEPLKAKILEENEDGVPTSINIWLEPTVMGAGYDRSRSLISVSSCGICGKRELEDLILKGDMLKTTDRLEVTLLESMFEKKQKAQSTFKITGGSHAAAAFTKDGKMIAIKEDIGRHNAVDKVIGASIEIDQLNQAKCLLVSGRISFEIVSKAYKAGIPFMAAVSAPSSLAVECAKAMGMTLFGYCRGNVATCYAHEDRISEANTVNSANA